jgi:hypothetical protein
MSKGTSAQLRNRHPGDRLAPLGDLEVVHAQSGDRAILLFDGQVETRQVDPCFETILR